MAWWLEWLAGVGLIAVVILIPTWWMARREKQRERDRESD
jgi:hypothetical protein